MNKYRLLGGLYAAFNLVEYAVFFGFLTAQGSELQGLIRTHYSSNATCTQCLAEAVANPETVFEMGRCHTAFGAGSYAQPNLLLPPKGFLSGRTPSAVGQFVWLPALVLGIDLLIGAGVIWLACAIGETAEQALLVLSISGSMNYFSSVLGMNIVSNM